MSNSVFTFIRANPFGLNDNGALSTPTFADIDHDGDQDAFVGDGFGGLYFYRNTGTAVNPTFAAAIKNPFGFNNASFYTRPDFVDIDNDGDLDAFVGNFDGITQFYRNTGTLTNPAFAAAVNNPFGLSDVGLQASPTFADIDNDGDQDAFIGNLAGNILFSRNTGTVGAPAFAAATTNPFGLNNVGAQASPAFMDSDGDGDLDLFVGSQDGDILFFKNNGSVNTPAFAASTLNPLGMINVDSNAAPTFADIDNDGDMDTFIGTKSGVINFLLNDSAAVFLTSGAGTDTLSGTTATHDTVNYAGAASAVTVALAVTTQQNTGGAGLDTLSSIENLVGSRFADDLTGNGSNNVLNGGAGDDVLDGSAGTDSVLGGLGNDTVFVNSATDVVIEYAGEGTDKISSSVTYTLPNNVENLTLTGAVAINGTGNSLANTMIGNSAANQLNGGDGNDVLNGFAGADTMIGGLGFDTFIVDNVGDVVTETSGTGNDTINSSVTYTMPLNVENLFLTGTATINGTGNGIANTIKGNSANNVLNGGAANDILDGGTGTNTLTGGAGNDVFRFSTLGHTDTVTDYSVPEDTIQLDNAVFTALGATGTLAATKFKVGAAAADADDFVIYNSTTGKLLYDADGSGAGAAIQVATIGTGKVMTNVEIVVV